MNTTQRPTPETDAAEEKYGNGNAMHAHCHDSLHLDGDFADFAKRLEQERDEAREELEREQMRLVACDVVAMADTESSREPARDMHKDYWSAAVESVIRRVDECIELRGKLEAMRTAIKQAYRALEVVSDCNLAFDERKMVNQALDNLLPFLKL